MSLEEELDSFYQAQKPPSDWRIYIGAKTILPVAILGAVLGSITLVGDVKASKGDETSLLSLAFDDPLANCIVSEADSLSLYGRNSAYIVWDAIKDNEKYRVLEGEVDLSPVGTELPVVPTSIVLSDIQQAIANLEQSVTEFEALDTQNLGLVGGSIDNVNTLAPYGPDMSLIASNIVTLQAAVGALTMIQAELNVTLSLDPEVEGVNYNTLAAIYAYAKTAVQAGGTVTVTIAENITITETELIVWDLDRLNLNLLGENDTGSTANVTATLNVHTGTSLGGLDAGLNFIGNGTFFTKWVNFGRLSGQGSAILHFGHGVNAILEVTRLVSQNTAAAIAADGANIKMSGTIVTTDRSCLEFRNSRVNINNGSLISHNGSSHTAVLLLADELSHVFVKSLTLDYVTSTASGATYIKSDEGSTTVVSSATFVGAAGVQYDPPADTYGNRYSRNVTAP